MFIKTTIALIRHHPAVKRLQLRVTQFMSDKLGNDAQREETAHAAPVSTYEETLQAANDDQQALVAMFTSVVTVLVFAPWVPLVAVFAPISNYLQICALTWNQEEKAERKPFGEQLAATVLVQFDPWQLQIACYCIQWIVIPSTFVEFGFNTAQIVVFVSVWVLMHAGQILRLCKRQKTRRTFQVVNFKPDLSPITIDFYKRNAQNEPVQPEITEIHFLEPEPAAEETT